MEQSNVAEVVEEEVLPGAMQPDAVVAEEADVVHVVELQFVNLASRRLTAP